MKFKAINQNREFNRCYKRGVSYVSPLLVTYVLKNRLGKIRIGVTASKKVGNAVKRNRAKRLLKESARLLITDIDQIYYIIFVSRGKTPHSNMNAVKNQMQEHLQKAGLIDVKTDNNTAN